MLNEEERPAKSIMVLEDHSLVREGFVRLLQQLEYQLTIHEAENTKQAHQICAQHALDLAIVDLTLDDENSFDFIKDVATSLPQMPILVVSGHDEKRHAERVLRLGARGYVMKKNSARTILNAVQTVLNGQIWLSDEIRDSVLSKITGNATPGDVAGIDSLTSRELEILTLTSQGLKRNEIANRLNISVNTVGNHLSSVKQKLGAASTNELHHLAHAHIKP